MPAATAGVVLIVECFRRQLYQQNRSANIASRFLHFLLWPLLRRVILCLKMRLLAAVWPTVHRRWSWRTTHVLRSLSYRLGIRHDFIQAGYRIDRLLPFAECFEAQKQLDRETDHLLWGGHFPMFCQVR